MLDRVIAGVIGLVLVLAIVWMGVGAGVVAFVAWLMPYVGLAGAAGIACAICVGLPVLWMLYAFLRSKRKKPIFAHHGRKEQAVVDALTELARERPLVAMVGATIFGAAEAVLKDRK